MSSEARSDTENRLQSFKMQIFLWRTTATSLEVALFGLWTPSPALSVCSSDVALINARRQVVSSSDHCCFDFGVRRENLFFIFLWISQTTHHHFFFFLKGWILVLGPLASNCGKELQTYYTFGFVFTVLIRLSSL